MRYVRIGNGLYAKSAAPLGIAAQIRLLQAGCDHRARDPLGMCYHCGDKASDYDQRRAAYVAARKAGEAQNG